MTKLYYIPISGATTTSAETIISTHTFSAEEPFKVEDVCINTVSGTGHLIVRQKRDPFMRVPVGGFTIQNELKYKIDRELKEGEVRLIIQRDTATDVSIRGYVILSLPS